MGDHPDAWVLEQLRAGDVRSAVDGVYRRHARSLRAFLRDRLGDSDAVEEILSEVFESLLKDLASFRGDAKLRTWLHTVVRRAVGRHFERARAQRERLRPLDGEAEQRPHASIGATWKQWIRQAYLLRLSSEERALVDLWLEGWSWREAAVKLGATEEGLRKRFMRLINRLAKASGTVSG